MHIYLYVFEEKNLYLSYIIMKVHDFSNIEKLLDKTTPTVGDSLAYMKYELYNPQKLYK